MPIWNGLDRDGYLNPAAMINLAALGGSLDQLLEQVERVFSDPASTDRIAGAPLLVRQPSMAPILESLRLA